MKSAPYFADGGAVVSGGASGLGLATARALADHGIPVTIIDLPAACDALAASGAIDDHIVAVAADVTDAGMVEKAFADHQRRHGPCRTNINCAGVIGGAMLFGRDAPLDGAAFSKVVAINLVGTFQCARAAAQQMRTSTPDGDGARGVIINTASIAAFDGMPGQAAYAASKGGVVAMTLPLARELARHGIRVCAIAPGVFSTPMIHGLDERTRSEVSDMLPLFPKRLGAAEDFAEFVLTILDSPFVNGEVIRFDGGLRMAAG